MWLFFTSFLLNFCVHSHSFNLRSFLSTVNFLYFSCLLSPFHFYLFFILFSNFISQFLILLPLPLICCGFNHGWEPLKSPRDWYFLTERRGICDYGKLQRPDTFNFQCSPLLSSVVLLLGIRVGLLTAAHNGKALPAWLLRPVSHKARCVWTTVFTLIAGILKLPFTVKNLRRSVWKTNARQGVSEPLCLHWLLEF